MGRTFSSLAVGDSLPAMAIQVSAEWVATDVAAKQDRSPWHSESSPWGGPVAPPTLTNADFDRFLRANDIPMNGIIPVKTSHEYFGAIPVGSTIHTTCTVVDRSDRKGRVYLTFEFVTTDDTGRLLITKRDTLLQMPRFVAAS